MDKGDCINRTMAAAAMLAESDTGRQAKFYSLTAAGRGQLEKETANWNRLSAAIGLVMDEA